ncbi:MULTISPECIES: hemerythrin domain-containing protein [Asticcacaulis]|uniref:hemerythrin domain-containing protein n=1 Tax=Asticcacaulis TaxID=76890 RepID=UPI001AE5E8D5|nr:MULTISPECIES: hemerythrin domain-containing protein [Asticcacaulis]MBP2159201.1 hemerythrin superfamily protein [Asticcacaulis solisilvae]MDR6800246.1 hemerythrin superfamily protein [Asticcacaulis sp. BE141]
MDIYNYLKKDHQKVADLMEQVIASKDPAERQSLFETIKMELTLHADTEEQTFYKAIEDATRSKQVEEKIEHANHEHDEIREYLEKLSTTPVTDELWLETFGEFKHSVTHHVEEEEGEIFEKAKKYLSSQEAKDLAKEMDALKKQSQVQSKVPADAMG